MPVQAGRLVPFSYCPRAHGRGAGAGPILKANSVVAFAYGVIEFEVDRRGEPGHTECRLTQIGRLQTERAAHGPERFFAGSPRRRLALARRIRRATSAFISVRQIAKLDRGKTRHVATTIKVMRSKPTDAATAG
jgi:hypothetical protein